MLQGWTTERLFTAVCFLLLFVLAYTRNVNWDEFYFLSHIHTFQDGRLDRPMQTFYVHGFTWLTWLPGGEMLEIFIARLVMIGFVATTAFSIHRIAREISNRSCADIAVLAFLTSGFLLAHGGSFRADPMAAALLTSSIAILMTTRMSALHIAAAAVLSALSVLITIKSVLYMPAFLAVLIWRKNEPGVLVRILVSGLLAGLICALLYLWHASGITALEENGTTANATDAAKRTLLNSGFLPRTSEAISWTAFSFAQIGLVVLALLGPAQRRVKIVLVLFAAPLLSILVYRNAYAYFFPFAVPLLMIAVAVGAQHLGQSRLLSRLTAIMVISAAVQTLIILPEKNHAQRATLNEVHRLFDQPVPYIDDSHMVASFPNPAFFMSSWGVIKYRDKAQPIFADIIETHQPPLLIANKFALKQAMIPDFSSSEVSYILPEDRNVLRRSYVHYSGAIWLAGREITLRDKATTLTLPFPGRYRLEAAQPIVVNGRVITAGTTMEFPQRSAILSGPSGLAIKLIWDTGTPPLKSDDLDPNIYAGFNSLLP